MQIRIRSYTFNLSEPYRAGTVITKAEAQALNNIRAENIQNNLRKLVVDAVALLGEGELLSQSTLAGLQAKLTEYDGKYQFVEKHNPKGRLGDIEEEAREIARERVEEQARRNGESLTDEQIRSLVLETEGLPGVVEEARLRVQARRSVLSNGLDSL